jgi:PAS domain S-box-containing protein
MFEGCPSRPPEKVPLMPDEIQTIILDSITEGVFTVDKSFRITSFNSAAESITGTPRARAIGMPCREILRASICEGRCALHQTMRTGKPVLGKNVVILDAAGTRRSISITTALLRDRDGEIVGGVETFRDLTMIDTLRKEIEREYSFEDIVSRSHRMRTLFDILPDVARSGSTVLLQGESGTGKELFARALHSLSPRKRKPFVAVNCAALPDTLLESELFGHTAGAFTDARTGAPGRFARAEGGTLFLDEIGDISPALQVRLLRVLQEKSYEPLGSSAPVSADVRIVAATNKTLFELVHAGTFREDLFYRINVVSLFLPPLRDRMEDIPLLVARFIAKMNHIQDRDITGMSDDAMACLMGYRFPGNVRELENIIERAFILCRGGEIDRHHLPDPICGSKAEREPGGQGSYQSFRQAVAAFITNALKRNGGNRTRTAAELGMHKTTLPSCAIRAGKWKMASRRPVSGSRSWRREARSEDRHHRTGRNTCRGRRSAFWPGGQVHRV